MPTPMFEIDTGTPGRLWIMPCPDGTRVSECVADYRENGADVIVSMLAQDEALALNLATEEQVCVGAGLHFVHHPIPDFGLPEPQRFGALVQQINDWLHAGQGVAVHCRAGIGRSGMMTSAVLIAQGHSAEDAVAKVSVARGVSIPDTVEQGNFLAAL